MQVTVVAHPYPEVLLLDFAPIQDTIMQGVPSMIAIDSLFVGRHER
jgi:hypothetical protein